MTLEQRNIPALSWVSFLQSCRCDVTLLLRLKLLFPHPQLLQLLLLSQLLLMSKLLLSILRQRRHPPLVVSVVVAPSLRWRFSVAKTQTQSQK
jgi:hypothetical protein